MSFLRKQPSPPTGMLDDSSPDNLDIGASFVQNNRHQRRHSSIMMASHSHRGSHKISRSKWKRARHAVKEAKVVQKSAGHVDKIVRDLTDGLPFLLDTPNQPIAKFHRSEIVVGNLLGRGVFARVFEVKDFDLHGEEEDEEQADELLFQQQLKGKQRQLSPQEQIIQEMGGSEALRANYDDESSSLGGNEGMPQIRTIDDRPLGRIAESESDEVDNSSSHHNDNTTTMAPNGGDAITTATSSTAPETVTSTNNPTPAATARIGGINRGSLPPQHNINRGSLPPMRPTMTRGLTTRNYQQHLMSESRMEMEQSTLRLRARDNIRSGKTTYALKHLTKTLLRNPKDFYLAAAALLVEAKYLAKMKHPNIIKVTGLALPGGLTLLDESSGLPIVKSRFSKQSNSSGGSGGEDHSRRSKDTEGGHSGGGGGGQHYDSYFLITERLTDTLDRRMRQWKRDQPVTRQKLADLSSSQKIQTWKHMMRKTSYALQLSNAIMYLHERNLLHRDVRPQNIGFIGDNQTIVLYNFGLCRELNPTTLKVQEDEVTALYGALGWRYTAVECFRQPVLHTPAHLVVNHLVAAGSAQFLFSSAGTRSGSFNLDGLSNSLQKKFGKGGRKKAGDDSEFKELERELRAVQEEYQEETGAAANNSNPLEAASTTRNSTIQPFAAAAAASSPDNERKSQENGEVLTPSYDLKVDVYSWAMVYYEMLTLNQPFSGMAQKEHLRKVAGPKGGQRPGVYQFDLTPSMISLLQRAWDQNPKKRPTMESVGRNLQLILRELETLIKAEQKTLLKDAGGTEEAVEVFRSREDRAAKRAALKEESERAAAKGQPGRLRKTRKSSIMETVRNKADGLFAKNQYRRGDVRESIMGPPPTGFLGPAPTAIPGLANPTPATKTREQRDSAIRKSEIDVDALEYEAWSSDGGDDGNSMSMEESEDPSSLTDHFGETGGVRENNSPAENTEVEIPVIVEGDENDEGSEHDEVGDAISALRNKKKDSPKSLPPRSRNLSSGSGDGSGRTGSLGRMRRKTKAEYKSRRMLDTFSLMERRSTNRMSRRTMRLSRASVWMMRRDVRIIVTICCVLITAAFCGASWAWYKKRQRTWLGIDLEHLGQHNMSNAREILEGAIMETCRRKIPSELDPNKPMLFQGGALSPVDLECTESLHGVLDEKMARVTGVPTKKPNQAVVGFLNIKLFDRPPPQPKKSRFRRKKPWKFFREPESMKADSNSVKKKEAVKENDNPTCDDANTKGVLASLLELSSGRDDNVDDGDTKGVLASLLELSSGKENDDDVES